MSEETKPANEIVIAKGMRTGKLPAKSNPKALLFSTFLKAGIPDPPKAFNYWKGKVGFPERMYGNDTVGDCTFASQAHAAVRNERIETRRTIEISDNAVLSAYYNLTEKLYGGGDTGAYETDALSNWRDAERTFRDTKDHPLTIDAYTRINHFDLTEIRRAIWSQKAKGIKICFNLPWAWRRFVGGVWDRPPTEQQPIGEWLPGSWGGHSVNAYGYEAKGIWITTWARPQLVTWEGVALYADEAHWYLDSYDSWRRRPEAAAKQIKINDLIDAVNAVSAIQIGR